MKKILTLVLLVYLMNVQKAMAQIPLAPGYTDFISMAATAGVASASASLLSKKTTASLEYGAVTAVSSTEIAGVGWLGSPRVWVDFGKYTTLCDGYRSPGKKTLCNARKQYLEDSYVAVLDLLKISTKEKLKNGVIEQIWEKYASICNLILKDLDQMREEAEETEILSHIKYKR